MKKVWGKLATTALTLVMVSTGALGGNAVQAQVYPQNLGDSVGLGVKEDFQRKIVGYFPGWAYNNAIQGNFIVTDLQWDDLTHIQYSFASIDPKTNKISLGDQAGVKAALEDDFTDYIAKFGPIKHKGKEVKLDSNLSYKGHFNLLQTMKKQYPDVKILISVGGWAGSREFYTMLDTDEGINTFADSCVDFIRQYGFDGVDIDFEYPSATSTSGNPDDQDLAEPRRAKLNGRYNLMMKTLREKLDKAAAQDSKYYSLTAAVTASGWVLGGMTDGEYAKYLDFLSVMSYDFHGAWNGYVENLANIYSDSNDTETDGQALDYLSMEWAYDYYRGVLPLEKILMGIPYYTRGWEKVNKAGGAETGLHGTSIKTKITDPGWGADKECNLWGDDDDHNGTIDASGANPLWHVLNLMDSDPNFKKYWDSEGKVPYVWNEPRKTFLSFEDEDSIKERSKFIKNNNLGGALIWVMNGDYSLNPDYDPTYDPTKVDCNDPEFNPNDLMKGKYIFGDTLTKTLKSEMNKMGDCKKTKDPWDELTTVDVDFDADISYDHPNGMYTFTIKNNTKEEIKGGWELAFDFPKSSKFDSCWDGTYTIKPNGDFNHITIKGGGWNVIKPGGSVTVKGQTKLCFSGVQHVTFNGKKPINLASGNEKPVGEKPLKGKLETTTPVTLNGEYIVDVEIPKNSGAMSYTLFENNKPIKTAQINPKDNLLKWTESFKEKEVGKYQYRLDLINSEGTTSSDALQIEVAKENKLLTATLKSNTETTDTGNYDLTINIPKLSKATKFVLYENDKMIKEGKVNPEATSEQVEVIKMADKKVGTYNYVVELSNLEEKTVTKAVSVEVTQKKEEPVGEKPAVASVSHNNWDGRNSYEIRFDMWWGVNGNEWKLYENGVLIYTGKLVKNGTQAQSGAFEVKDRAPGVYTYKVELINEAGGTMSNEISVKVTQEVSIVEQVKEVEKMDNEDLEEKIVEELNNESSEEKVLKKLDEEQLQPNNEEQLQQNNKEVIDIDKVELEENQESSIELDEEPLIECSKELAQ